MNQMGFRELVAQEAEARKNRGKPVLRRHDRFDPDRKEVSRLGLIYVNRTGQRMRAGYADPREVLHRRLMWKNLAVKRVPCAHTDSVSWRYPQRRLDVGVPPIVGRPGTLENRTVAVHGQMEIGHGRGSRQLHKNAVSPACGIPILAAKNNSCVPATARPRRLATL